MAENRLPYYQSLIVEMLECTPAAAADIEILMRAETPTGCLDAISRRAFRKLALACAARASIRAAHGEQPQRAEVVVGIETLNRMRERGLNPTVLGPVGQTTRERDVRFLVRVERPATPTPRTCRRCGGPTIDIVVNTIAGRMRDSHCETCDGEWPWKIDGRPVTHDDYIRAGGPTDAVR